MVFLNIVVAVLCGFTGVLLGIRECKKEFGIPKGVTHEHGHFSFYADEDYEEVVNGNILDY